MARVAMNCFQAFPTLPWPARPPGFFPIRAITGRAPAHFSADVRSALDTVYAGRLIEWGGTVNWPARSPHLSCLDFFLCGYVNCLVYASPVNSDEALVAGYIREMPGVFANVRQSLRGGVGPASLLVGALSSSFCDSARKSCVYHFLGVIIHSIFIHTQCVRTSNCFFLF
ncbi:uncharacterized protein TNCV_3518362 [Trichonephila clavipes]|uniref:Uncharacterized protein n=1 Tax=Trichonephila clavipes TaxID=2585209 RepID=A0A8X6VR75_TRICX|nr:uncharacterized protein TNCV_3518362 [Trichonephila clavipes]